MTSDRERRVLSDGNVFYIGSVDWELEDIVLPLTREIQKQREYEEGRIDLYINSYGGYSHIMFHIVELMEMAKGLDIVVRTIVTNAAYSSGSMLAIAGTPGERYISKAAQHLIHYGYTGSDESTPRQIERNAKHKAFHFKTIINHYKRYADVPNIDDEMLDDGFYVPANKCIKFGLADKYTNRFDIGYYEGE